MRLTVLGCAGSYPAPARLCSSYLVESGGTRLLLDCGNGSLANLQRFCRVDEVSAVVVTHHHVDHMADLVGLYHILRFQPQGPGRVPVYTTAGVIAVMEALLAGDPVLQEVCRFHRVRAGSRIGIGPLEVSFHPARHPIETLAVRVRSPEGVLAYSADSGPAPELAECARGADLFLCEATWLAGRAGYPADLHLTAEQAGECATEAAVGRLVVTHVAHPAQPAAAAAQARRTFAGPVDAAEDLAAYDVAPAGG